MIVVAHRTGLNGARRVTAARGFRKAEEDPFLAAQHRIQILLLLHLRRFKKLGLPGAAEGVITRRVEPAAMLRAFDGDQHARDHIDFRPAIFRRRVQTIQAHCLGFFDQIGEDLRLDLVGVRIEVLLERQDLLTHETSNHVDDHRLLFGEGEIHDGIP